MANAPAPLRPNCLIERVIDDALAGAEIEAERVLEQRLEFLTLADLDAAVAELHAASPSISGALS